MTRTLTSRMMMSPTVNWKRGGRPSRGQPWRCSCKVRWLLPLAVSPPRPMSVTEHHGRDWVRAARCGGLWAHCEWPCSGVYPALLFVRVQLLHCSVVTFATSAVPCGSKNGRFLPVAWCFSEFTRAHCFCHWAIFCPFCIQNCCQSSYVPYGQRINVQRRDLHKHLCLLKMF